MLEATAVRSFRRSDTKTWVKRGQVITGDDQYVRQLERLQSVREVKAIESAPENKANPFPAAGEKSSASPVARRSRRKTAPQSDAGEQTDPTNEA